MVPATPAAAAIPAAGRSGGAECWANRSEGDRGGAACRVSYLGGRLPTAGEHRGQPFALRRGLQTLARLDLSQQLRIVARRGHHVERLGAWAEAGEETLARCGARTPTAPYLPSAAASPSQLGPRPSLGLRGQLSRSCPSTPAALRDPRGGSSLAGSLCGPTLRSPPGCSRASPPHKNQSLPTVLLCALTSDFTGGWMRTLKDAEMFSQNQDEKSGLLILSLCLSTMC